MQAPTTTRFPGRPLRDCLWFSDSAAGLADRVLAKHFPSQDKAMAAVVMSVTLMRNPRHSPTPRGTTDGLPVFPASKTPLWTTPAPS